VDLFVVPVYQFGRFPDALGFGLEDSVQEFQILLAEETTEFRVRSEIQDWLSVADVFPFLSGLDAASRSLIEAITFTDGDFERGHGVSLLMASYSDQSHETGDISSTSCLNRS